MYLYMCAHECYREQTKLGVIGKLKKVGSLFPLCVSQKETLEARLGSKYFYPLSPFIGPEIRILNPSKN